MPEESTMIRKPKHLLSSAIAGFLALTTASANLPAYAQANDASTRTNEAAEPEDDSRATDVPGSLLDRKAGRPRLLKNLRNRRPLPVRGGPVQNSLDPSIPNIQNQSPQTLPIPFDPNTTTGRALNLILNQKIDEARELLVKAHAEGKRAGNLDPEIPYFLAAMEAHAERYTPALKYLAETQNLIEKSGKDMRFQLLLNKRIADCNYKNRDMKTALSNYKAALFLAQRQQNVPAVLTCEILESVVGCQTHLKDYVQAEKDCRSLIETTRAQISEGGLPAVLHYSWSMIQLAEILKKAGKKAEFKVAQKDWQNVMAQLISMRMAFESAGMLPEYDQILQMFRVAYVKALSPKCPADIAWAGCDFRVKTLPIIVWRQKGAQEPVAAIICIHGLGLENRAFTNTARKLTERGYLVVALDVRGFGAWCQTRGEEDLDYDQCLTDISDLVGMVKERHPQTPVFILGESMGGAIALRAAAQLSSQISGIISSVPSAERYQQRRMSLQTAMHFIVDPNKPFDVGSYVADRATSEADMRQKWTNDPKARLDLSPTELIKFDAFMRATKRRACEIKHVPVFMLQGLKDRLVKPKGTFELFEAVSSDDKSILVQGLSEHLMFESPNPDQTIIDAVDSWVRQRADKTQQTSLSPIQ